jgi:N-acetylmuramoyl-L-alanine amidase
MTTSGKNNPLILLIIFFASTILYSAVPESGRLALHKVEGRNYVSFMDIVRTFNIRFTYDMFLQRGRLYHESHTAIVTVGFSVIIADGRLIKSNNEIIRKKGMVLIPEDSAEEIIRSFFPGIKLAYSSGRINFSFDQVPSVPDEKIVIPERYERKTDAIGFIVIDPGHGGKDPGALGVSGLREKDIVLKISIQLEQELKIRFKDLKIILLRRTDKFLELAARTKAANRHLKKGQNGIFISIHINASVSPKASGFETYFLSQNPSNDEARKTAALENDVIVLEDKKGKNDFEDTDYIEAMMLTTQIQKESSLLADSVQKGMRGKIRSISSKGVKKADFFVLRGALMPAVLVEAGYITNKKDAAYIRQSKNQQEIAEGISDGVENFIKAYNEMHN